MQISGLGRNGRLGDINAVKYGRYSEEIQVNIQIFLFYKKADILNKLLYLTFKGHYSYDGFLKKNFLHV